MLKRGIVEREAPKLSSQGFKMLLDIVLTADGPLRIVHWVNGHRSSLCRARRSDPTHACALCLGADARNRDRDGEQLHAEQCHHLLPDRGVGQYRGQPVDF